jgi:hypothetical protein
VWLAGVAAVLAACAASRPPSVPAGVSVECATAQVVGLRWSPAASRGRPPLERVLRDGRPIGVGADGAFADTSVAAATTYSYSVEAADAAGRIAASPPLRVTTAPASPSGDAPYCMSHLIHGMRWDWDHALRAAEGSDLWPVTWGADGDVYAFFGDGGGFGGDDRRGRTSFGIARIGGAPPPTAATEVNVYGGYRAARAATVNGKASALFALGADFYAIAGIYRPTDAKFHNPAPISGSPSHLEMAYSRAGPDAWQDAAWTFCDPDADVARPAAAGAFCPSGFVSFGRANAGAADQYVYLYGTNAAAAAPNAAAAGATGPSAAGGVRTYLARVDRRRLLVPTAYRYFAGLDRGSRPVWSASAAAMQAVFVDRNPPQPGCGGRCAMAGTLEEAIYDAPLQRYIGVAQADYLAQTAFYESAHPWGPWRTLEYDNIAAADGHGGWGALGAAAGGSLGVHAVNAWTSADGLTLWMVYSSDGKAPPGALFPPPGSTLDAFHLVRVELQRDALRPRPAGP